MRHSFVTFFVRPFALKIMVVNNIILFEHALVIKMFFSCFALKACFARSIAVNHASHLPTINMVKTHAKSEILL